MGVAKGFFFFHLKDLAICLKVCKGALHRDDTGCLQ